MSDRAAARAFPAQPSPPHPAPRAARPRAVPTTRTARRPEVVAAPAPTRSQRPRRQLGGDPATRRTPFVLLVVALLVGTTLGLLIVNTAIAVDSLRATQLQAENAERAQEVQRLEQRVVSGGSPARIASAAVAAGLVPAGPAAYLVIAPDGTVVLRGTPEPAPGPAASTDVD